MVLDLVPNLYLCISTVTNCYEHSSSASTSVKAYPRPPTAFAAKPDKFGSIPENGGRTKTYSGELSYDLHSHTDKK